MMILPWQMRCRCGECGYAVNAAGMKRVPASAVKRLLCPRCGGSQWSDPMPGRLVSAAVWWKPWTWFQTAWQWREADAVPMPRSPEMDLPPPPKPEPLRPLPGGKP